MNILVVSRTPTHPLNAGNRWGIFAQVKILKQYGNDVHFLYVEHRRIQRSLRKEYNNDFIQTKNYWGDKFYCFKVSMIQRLWMSFVYHWRWVFNGGELHVDDQYPVGLASYVRELCKKTNYEILIVNYFSLSKLIEKTCFPKNAIFTHDCYAYRNIVVKEKCFFLNAHSEAIAMQRAKHLFAVQDDEASYFSIISPDSMVYTIYSKYEYHQQPIAGNKNICYLASDNTYNVNGIIWFIREVWPMIKGRHDDAHLIIGGKVCEKLPEDVRKEEGCEILGYVNSPDVFYSQADVAINPVFQGTGLKIKTFEAISYGKITLVHPHSKKGIYNKDSAPLFSSDIPSEWADFLDEVWTNKDRIIEIKNQCGMYLSSMNKYVDSEYRRFLAL